MSSGEDLDRLEAGCNHNQRDPSLADQDRAPVEAGRGKVDERKCSVALGVSGEGGCGIVAAIRSWSSEVAHQTSVQGGSSEEVQAQE